MLNGAKNIISRGSNLRMESVGIAINRYLIDATVRKLLPDVHSAANRTVNDKQEITMTKQGYYVQNHEDADYGYAIVAESLDEAKDILWKYSETIGEGEWNQTDLVATVKPEAKIDHLPIGLIEDLRTGLEVGIFTYIENFECDVCGCDDDNFVEFVDGKVVCRDCRDHMYQS